MAHPEPQVLVVSKPLVPPWDDGGKTLVRELVAHSQGVRYRVPTTEDGQVPWPGVEAWRVYSGQTGYSPGLVSKARVFVKLLFAPKADIHHFFFAPNRVSSASCRIATTLRKGFAVQTVCSAPQDFAGAATLLFGRKVVVLSEHTRSRFVDAGCDEHRLVLIPPGVTVPPEPEPERIRNMRATHGFKPGDPVVLFPGDYDYSRAARTTLDAAVRVCSRVRNCRFVFACRLKNQSSSDEEQRLKARVAQANLAHRIRFVNLVDDFLNLLAAVDLCVLPAESTYGKVDLPLTLIEAMARKTPVVVADCGPLPELIKDGAGIAVRPVDPEDLADAIEALICDRARLSVLSETARTVALNRFSARQMASLHEDLYGEILEKGQ